MRVLWIVMDDSLYKSESSNSYNGCGWIIGLKKAMESYAADINIGITFLTTSNIEPFKTNINGYEFYPIYDKPMTSFSKLLYYWHNYKKYNNEPHKGELFKVITDFSPDVIHLFGIENSLAYIINATNIPVVAHLQGILNPYCNSFFPQGMNIISAKLNGNFIRENLFNNNICFGYNSMRVRAIKERSLFKGLQYAMGRTMWDKNITDLFSPNCKYFHVDEILRDEFYLADKWTNKSYAKIKIVSTISETVYKGLDVILKTAKFLKELNVDYEWSVIGINKDSQFVHFFEKQYKIEANRLPIRFLGVKKASEIVSLLQSSSLYIHPSYIDNSPNSVCEAQILGVPIVACNVGGIGSLIKHGEIGWLVPANSLYELAYLVKHYNDYDIGAISKKEIKTAEDRHSKGKIINSLLDCYEKCINMSKV